MSYKEWLIQHGEKHKKIVAKLIILGYNKKQIIEYFDYENMRLCEEDFCLLYSENKKCHEMQNLNCYLCACPNFRFLDDGMVTLEGNTVYSMCSIGSIEGKQQNFDGKIHQDCSRCTIPHEKDYIEKVFDINWLSIMKDCEIKR